MFKTIRNLINPQIPEAIEIDPISVKKELSKKVFSLNLDKANTRFLLKHDMGLELIVQVLNSESASTTHGYHYINDGKTIDILFDVVKPGKAQIVLIG